MKAITVVGYKFKDSRERQEIIPLKCCSQLQMASLQTMLVCMRRRSKLVRDAIHAAVCRRRYG
jgi:hypothetical protein